MRYTGAPLPPEVVAAIIAESATGASSRTVAAKLGISPFSVRKYAGQAGFVHRRPRSRKPRPETSCRECGARCRSPQRLCRDCWNLQPNGRDEPTDDVALTNGRWVPNGRGTLVWQADDERPDRLS